MHTLSDSDLCVFLPLSFSPYAVLMWTMARHQAVAPWTQWPARAQASSCRQILSTANGESRSSTAPTVTMTSHPSLCPETPPLPVTCESMVSFASTGAFIKYPLMLLVVPNVVNSFFSASLNLCHSWMFIRPGLKAATVLIFALVGSVHDQQLIVWCHIYS